MSSRVVKSFNFALFKDLVFLSPLVSKYILKSVWPVSSKFIGIWIGIESTDKFGKICHPNYIECEYSMANLSTYLGFL